MFNDAYARKTGMPVFPGSLNVALEVPFEWFAPTLQHTIIRFPKEEYGGERDILLLPCSLRSLRSQKAFLWTATTAASGPGQRGLVEIIASESLRDAWPTGREISSRSNSQRAKGAWRGRERIRSAYAASARRSESIARSHSSRSVRTVSR